MYLKIVKKDGSPICLQKSNIKYRVGEIYESELEESKEECVKGVYFIAPKHLLIWRDYILDSNNKILVVKPCGRIVEIKKGYRTDRLKIIRELKRSELKRIAKKEGLDIEKNIGYGDTLIGWDGATLIGADKSNLSANDRSILIGGEYSTLTGGVRSMLTAWDCSTLTAWHCSTLTAGNNSSLTASHWASLKSGYKSTLTAGDCSTLTGGDKSTLTAGDYSTLKIFGKECYIIKKGKGCVLHQIFFDETGNYKSIILDLDEALKDYKEGDKIKIVKGQVIEVIK